MEPDQLTVRTLIEHLRRLVAEHPAVADMPVELNDSDEWLTPCIAVAIGPRSVVLSESQPRWVQCVCGHGVAEHGWSGGGCDACQCPGYSVR